MTIQVPITLSDGAVLPSYQTAGAAGMDLCSTEPVILEPMQRAMVPTGLRLAIPEGFEGQIRPRSGLAIKKGISMVNSPGTIDCDYRGEIKIILINLSLSVVKLDRGERIAQLVFCPVAKANLELVANLEGTERGDSGFGSTGT
jgi:dUTP pyrophosphatase